MRGAEGVAEVTQKAAGTDEVPARSADRQAPASIGAGTGSRDPSHAPARSGAAATLGDVGAGVAFFVAVRFLIPRLLRRL